MTPVSPSGVTGSASAANFSDEVFAEREERLHALMLQAQAGDEAAYRVLLTRGREGVIICLPESMSELDEAYCFLLAAGCEILK